MLDYPHNLDAERCVIGCLLMGATDKRLGPKHFYSELHARLFELISTMRQQGKDVDPVTVRHEAQKAGFTVPGVDMVRFLESVTQVAHLETYVSILLDNWQRRRFVEMANYLYRSATDWSVEVEDIWVTVRREYAEHKRLAQEVV